MRYYFCSEKCKHLFDHNPQVYLDAELTATNVSE
jgi:YHS domain-containing protein